MATPSRLGRRVAIIDGYRTPFCKAGTSFNKLTSQDLGKAVVQELVARTEIDPNGDRRLVYGNVVPTVAAPNVAREMVLAADLPKHIHATTVMRACASSTEATDQRGQRHRPGLLRGAPSSAAWTASATCRSSSPAASPTRWSGRQQAKNLPDRLKAFAEIRPKHLIPIPPAIAERSTGKTMGQHAEMMAKENEIPREAQDEFALRSHQLAAGGHRRRPHPGGDRAGLHAPNRAGRSPRTTTSAPDTTLEALAKLRPVFDKKYGSVTAGNACPITDGASALLIMSEEKAKALGYEPMGYIRGYAYAAVDPALAAADRPTFAIAKVLELTGLKLKDIDLVDMHEAFAAQVLSNVKAMGSKSSPRSTWAAASPVGEVDMDRFNVMGGSIAIGHPFAATAGRQIITVLNELKRRGKNLGLVAQCAAGSMGAALILERE